MNWYLAARLSRQREIAKYAKQLEAAGEKVVSRWIHSGRAIATLQDDEIEAQAISHMEDLVKSDVVVLFSDLSEPVHPAVVFGSESEGTAAWQSRPSLGGRHVEFGAALGFNKQLVLIGQRENCFHWLPNVDVFESFDEMMKTILTGGGEDGS